MGVTELKLGKPREIPNPYPTVENGLSPLKRDNFRISKGETWIWAFRDIKNLFRAKGKYILGVNLWKRGFCRRRNKAFGLGFEWGKSLLGVIISRKSGGAPTVISQKGLGVRNLFAGKYCGPRGIKRGYVILRRDILCSFIEKEATRFFFAAALMKETYICFPHPLYRARRLIVKKTRGDNNNTYFGGG